MFTSLNGGDSNEEVTCYDCGDSDEKITLYYCCDCKEEEKKQKFFCEDCGAPSHKKKNHKVNKKKACFLMNENQLAVAKNEGKEKFEKALGNFLTSGKDMALAAVKGVANAGVGACGGVIGSAIGTSVAVEVIENGSKELVKGAIGGLAAGTGIVTAGLFVCEAIYLGIQFGRGKMSSNELGRRLCKSAVRSVGAFGCAMAGAAIGAVGGPIGIAIGGILGGIIGGIVSSVAMEKLLNKYWPTDEEKARRDQIKEALRQFGFDKNRLTDKTHFNEAIIKRKYHSFCRIHHPDRPGGNIQAFEALALNYGLLLALLDNYDGKNKEKDAMKFVLAIAY